MVKTATFLAVFSFWLLLIGPVQAGQELTFVAAKTPVGDSYRLPHPGLLPSHPLYFVKALRDRLLLALTQSPLEKAQIYLFFSDKRLATALALADQGEKNLAATSLTYSFHFLDKSLEMMTKLDRKERKSVDFALHLINGLRYRQKILWAAGSRFSEDQQPTISGHQEAVGGLLQRLSSSLLSSATL